MNLTSLISKSANPRIACNACGNANGCKCGRDGKTPASQLTYEPQLDNQRDPNHIVRNVTNLTKLIKTKTLESIWCELHFGKFHGAHLNQKA